MLIKQIIEFELRGHGLPGLICAPTTVIFMTNKNLYGISSSELFNTVNSLTISVIQQM